MEYYGYLAFTPIKHSTVVCTSFLYLRDCIVSIIKANLNIKQLVIIKYLPLTIINSYVLSIVDSEEYLEIYNKLVLLK